MSSTSKSLKLTLAAKLANKSKVVKQIGNGRNNELVADIEDIAGTSSSSQLRYFSPVQTRNQRKTGNLNRSTTIRASKSLGDTVKKTVTTKEVVAQKGSVKKIVPKTSTSKVATKKKIGSESDIKSEPPIKVKAPDAKQSGDYKQNWAPLGWWRTLENIRKMRSDAAAPVDTMGCHQCADVEADPKTQRFHKLVALMLSSQTKDEVTFAAMTRLKAETLTPGSIVTMPVGILATHLCPVSFYRNKAKYLKQTAEILIDKYNCDIPNNIDELVALPGVGPKMAHICMATAWNQVTGIGVDVHVHRISNRLGWVPSRTKEPEQTRKALQSWLPQELWSDVNHLLVGFGQTICTPLRPKCDQCLNALTCPAASESARLKAANESGIKLCPAIEEFEKKLLNIK